jgi:hypothetical protein
MAVAELREFSLHRRRILQESECEFPCKNPERVGPYPRRSADQPSHAWRTQGTYRRLDPAFFHCPAELNTNCTRQHRIQRGTGTSGLPSEFGSQYPENLRFDFTATGDYILAHSFFERSRRRSAMLRELKSRNPNVRI